MKDQKIIYGNRSRFAKNWISGPNDEIRKQLVPGYTGHTKGLVSENIHGTSYANCTAKAIYKKTPYGFDLKPKERFRSMNSNAFVPKNNRRIGK